MGKIRANIGNILYKFGDKIQQSTIGSEYVAMQRDNAILQDKIDAMAASLSSYESTTDSTSFSQLYQETDFASQIKQIRYLMKMPESSSINSINSTIATVMNMRIKAATGYGIEIMPKMGFVSDTTSSKKKPNKVTKAMEELQDKRIQAALEGNYDLANSLKALYVEAAKNNGDSGDSAKAMQLKSVCDFWAANVNNPLYWKNGKPEVARTMNIGLDALREKFHRNLYEGIVIVKMEIGQMDMGDLGSWTVPVKIEFIDPLWVEPFLLSNPAKDITALAYTPDFYLQPSDIAWRFKNDYDPAKTVLQTKGNIVYAICPVDMDDYQTVPIPFLVARGAVAQAQAIMCRQHADHKLAYGLIRNIYAIYAGSTELIKAFPKQIDLRFLQERAKVLLNSVTSKAGLTNFVGLLPDEDIKKVESDVSALLSKDKFAEPYRALLDALGIMTIDYDETGAAKQVMSPKPMIIDLLSYMRMERRFWERKVFTDIIIGMNTEFADMKAPRILQNPMSIFYRAEDYNLIKFFFQTGHISDTSALASINYDVESEATLRTNEQQVGYDAVFVPRETFAQTAVTDGTGDNQSKTKNGGTPSDKQISQQQSDTSGKTKGQV